MKQLASLSAKILAIADLAAEQAIFGSMLIDFLCDEEENPHVALVAEDFQHAGAGV